MRAVWGADGRLEGLGLVGATLLAPACFAPQRGAGDADDASGLAPVLPRAVLEAAAAGLQGVNLQDRRIVATIEHLATGSAALPRPAVHELKRPWALAAEVD